MEQVYLLLGSNLGDSKKYLSDAVQILENRVGKVLKLSSLYQTESWGKTNQPDFINQVISLETNLEPRKLLEEILSIENELGRKRVEKWGSRTIDIDILFFGNRIVEEEGLIIPHPLLHTRRFTLMPLCQLEPDLIHPVLGDSAINLLQKIDDNLEVKKLP
ncbi:2-amino-4-hydroxy-6-hydroxymethyldihydropteridine diphosphokinase [Daejeonella oryzae]|uniref:2-amino-4-hydroxy-6- hydroxymethyldihydropteridine diphosphokinase n=1 Tax=Daejeonella oryzae TaxID=1122943 RepID=UPI00040066B2|nr:2-amino-4-hydroxy-6-hydroxymethyldihydropteridine diphosphokinase [Daejeonella oryzae]